MYLSVQVFLELSNYQGRWLLADTRIASEDCAGALSYPISFKKMIG